jgi:catechol 2,3-dioxygenase-like lactoylglutathione lyase family enzyme
MVDKPPSLAVSLILQNLN